MRTLTSRWSAGLAVTATILVGASAAQAHVLHHAPRHRVGRGTSTNWSGYAIDGTGATRVTATWTAEKASCASGEKSWSSPWVGIDGDNSNTVEQTGTDSDCNGGKADYYAWYEMYPKNAVILPMTVTPGHTYTGLVTYSGGIFTLSLTDNTTHVTDTEHISKKAQRSSVEWIVEGPSSGLLSNFGTEPFTAASATINGTNAGLSAFGSSAQSITMVDKSGTITRAQPSSVSNNGFTDTWFHG